MLTNDSNYQTAEQVNSTVTTEIAKVVANAPEDFDTLKEMSDWIAGHENDASAMNSAISDNKANIETLQTDVANINTSLGGKLDKTFTGVEMEAESVEDQGAGVCFHVFVYNVQPGINIDYRTGENEKAADYDDYR